MYTACTAIANGASLVQSVMNVKPVSREDCKL